MGIFYKTIGVIMQHYLRSADNYDHQFNLAVKVKKEDGTFEWKVKMDPETAEPMRWVLLGREHKNKNISIIDNDEDFEWIMSFEQIKQLMKRHVVQEVPEIPQNYYNAMELASRNAQLLNNARTEKEIVTQQLSQKDQEIEALKDKLKKAGIE